MKIRQKIPFEFKGWQEYVTVEFEYSHGHGTSDCPHTWLYENKYWNVRLTAVEFADNSVEWSIYAVFNPSDEYMCGSITTDLTSYSSAKEALEELTEVTDRIATRSQIC